MPPDDEVTVIVRTIPGKPGPRGAPGARGERGLKGTDGASVHMSDDHDTLPPPELELEHVAQFEREIERLGENDARLAHLAELVNVWGRDGE